MNGWGGEIFSSSSAKKFSIRGPLLFFFVPKSLLKFPYEDRFPSLVTFCLHYVVLVREIPEKK